jgi:predicted RNase H-like nuclease (RuvC/YqgF family)
MKKLEKRLEMAEVEIRNLKQTIRELKKENLELSQKCCDLLIKSIANWD